MLTNEQLQLINLTAQRLTGKKIWIRQQQPATAGAMGEAHKSEGGRLVIDLSPTIPENKKLYVILHEIAHHKRHRFLETKVYRAAPGTLEPNPQTMRERIGENTADKQAAEWLEWGTQHAHSGLYKLAPLEAVLIGLLDYPTGD